MCAQREQHPELARPFERRHHHRVRHAGGGGDEDQQEHQQSSEVGDAHERHHFWRERLPIEYFGACKATRAPKTVRQC